MRLGEIAFSRAGDKGDTLDITLIARNSSSYDLLRKTVTSEAVSNHLKQFVRGEVTRYELPQLNALKFVLRGALDGGVTRSLALDRHGKTLSHVLLDMEMQEQPSDTDDDDAFLYS